MNECTIQANGIELCYEVFGEPDGRPLLLIMGLGGPMTWWDEEFCEQLAERGFRVIRYDNRDTGRSTAMHGRAGLLPALLLRRSPYQLTDLADDAAALLDALEIPAAHVTGVSMGGMIAQTLAIRHPSRVLSLTSIMSTTGNKLVGLPSPRAMKNLLQPAAKDRDSYIEQMIRTFRVIGSPGYPAEEARLRARAATTYDRGTNPAGTVRHLGAIMAAPDRTSGLRKLRIPALVIHGAADPLVNPSGGRATARAIPGAELDMVPGMGHDTPPELWPRFVNGIVRTADRAEAVADRHIDTT
ncbi:alpha/beta fold hydrolase [Saccharothrix sp. AJ9571]|nr:alpha/beta fold hydrolase [Saccharothrix sp. AJ9571]